MKRIAAGILLLSCLLQCVKAQQVMLPIGSYSDGILSRLEIMSPELPGNYFHSSSHSFSRQKIALFADSFNTVNTALSNRDLFNLNYLQNDNFEWSNSQSTRSEKHPIQGLYDYKAALYAVRIPDFNLIINPVLYYDFGTAQYKNHPVGINNRGIEIRGNITPKIGFYSQVSDEIITPTQAINEFYQQDSVVAGAGFYKGVGYGYNYFLASGYVSLQLNKYMDLQFGEGRHFIGDGVRTFILSDFSRDYLYLRLNTRIWKLHYTNLFGQLLDFAPINNYIINPRKYFASHHLSLNVSKRCNIGIFETIIFQRDSGYADHGFELHYLNPIIFYKAVENGLNSTDKSIVGLNFKYNAFKRVQLYGQWVFSEFVFNELIHNRSAWLNKYAYQIGFKAINVLGVKNLDIQVEQNVSRPYMYTSFSERQTYSNYNQSLSHPLGANFREWIGIIKYQPLNRLNLQARCIYAEYGNDTNGSNWGKNILLSYKSRMQEYGNHIGQGVATQLWILDFSASYMAKHNVFIDLKYSYRKTTSEMDIFRSRQDFISLGIRVNIARRYYDF